MKAKIRDSQNKKIPYIIILGDDEADNSTVSIRTRSGDQINGISLEEAIKLVNDEIISKGMPLILIINKL